MRTGWLIWRKDSSEQQIRRLVETEELHMEETMCNFILTKVCNNRTVTVAWAASQTDNTEIAVLLVITVLTSVEDALEKITVWTMVYSGLSFEELVFTTW